MGNIRLASQLGTTISCTCKDMQIPGRQRLDATLTRLPASITGRNRAYARPLHLRVLNNYPHRDTRPSHS